jgi:hypothetical protein
VLVLDDPASVPVSAEEVPDQARAAVHLVVARRVGWHARRHPVVRLPPGLQVAEDQLARLVERDPPMNALPHRRRDPLGVALEAVGEVLVERVDVERPDVVEEGEHGLHPRLPDRVDDRSVVGERLFVEDAGLGLDPSPADAEAEHRAAEARREPDVLLVAVPEIGRPPARCLARVAFPFVPDVGVAGVERLALVVGRRHAEVHGVIIR